MWCLGATPECPADLHLETSFAVPKLGRVAAEPSRILLDQAPHWNGQHRPHLEAWIMCNAAGHPRGCTCGWGHGTTAVPRGRGSGEGPPDHGDPTNCVKPSSCPECSADVFFVRHNGGCAWFDDLGPPWPLHPCFAQRERRSARVVPLISFRDYLQSPYGRNAIKEALQERAAGTDSSNGPVGSCPLCSDPVEEERLSNHLRTECTRCDQSTVLSEEACSRDSRERRKAGRAVPPTCFLCGERVGRLQLFGHLRRMHKRTQRHEVLVPTEPNPAGR